MHTRAVAPTSRENIGWWNFETSPVTRRLDMVPDDLMARWATLSIQCTVYCLGGHPRATEAVD